MRTRLLAASCGFLFALMTGNAARADGSELSAEGGCAATSAAAVTVNAFNRTTTMNDLFVVHNGEMKKYEIAEGGIDESDWSPSTTKTGVPFSQPVVVIYGGKPGSHDIDDALLYVITKDGYLHALDPKTGVERWAYTPEPSTAPKHDVIDNGSIRVLKYDTNGDGVVDPADNDRVILFFGQGRGGDRYYAVDVTHKKPQPMWAIGPTTAGLKNIGQTWSTPTLARIRISNAVQNSQKLVLIFGGGYDPAEESVAYQAADTRGNALYIVDAVKGTVLWSAGRSEANLTLERMDHAIPSDVAVLDLDGDGYADRMYVGDTAAQLWRFDIFNDKPVEQLVAGGVIASLGTHDDATHANAAARRFYNAPDVAAVRRKGVRPFFNIAIGSGHRGRTQNTEVQDRFYSIRDYQAFEQLNQKQYDAVSRRILQDKDLLDVSANVGASEMPLASKNVETTDPGWKVLLNAPGDSWVGEKVLASATTANGQILFPTFAPAGCSNRIYSLDVFSGAGRYEKLSQGTIAPQVVFLFPESGNRAGQPYYPPVLCLSGTEVLGACRNFNPLVKTYWSESNAR
jgi:type IV pilus assembly protein PilY1